MNIFRNIGGFLGKHHNYLIAGNVTNAFAIGEVGASDDFFLVGAEPEEESIYPLLTGNILDSEGQLLFRLVRNVLVVNPGNCSKIYSNLVGYEIHDSAGKLIFKVRTLFEARPELNGEEFFITTLAGNFYNKTGQLVFAANSGDPDERIEATAKFALGYTNVFGLTQAMSADDREIAALALSSGGVINQPIRGEVVNQEIEFDGKIFINASLTRCKVHIRSGNFAIQGPFKLIGCELFFYDDAANLKNFVISMMSQTTKDANEKTGKGRKRSPK